MRKHWKKLIAIIIPVAFAASLVLPTSVTLTPLSLSNEVVYVSQFKDNTTGAIIKQKITKAQFDKISKQDFLPHYFNATWLNSYDTYNFTTGTTTVQDGQVFTNGEYSEVKLPNYKARIIKSNLLDGNTLTPAGVEEVTKVSFIKKAQAAIAFDAFTDAGFVNPVNTSMSFSHTVAAVTGPYLVVGYQQQFSKGDVVTGITYNSVAMTKITVTQNPNGDYIGYWYLANADTGAHNVTISVSSNPYIGAMACSYNGTRTTSPIDASGNVSNADNSTLTDTLTASVANDWFISVYGSAGSGSDPTSTTSTKRGVNSAVYVACFDNNAALSAGSNDMTLTPAAGAVRNIIEGALVFPPVVPPPPPTLPFTEF